MVQADDAAAAAATSATAAAAATAIPATPRAAVPAIARHKAAPHVLYELVSRAAIRFHARLEAQPLSGAESARCDGSTAGGHFGAAAAVDAECAESPAYDTKPTAESIA